MNNLLMVYITVKNKEQAKSVIHLINWMITDGQEFSSSLLYVPLADKVTKLGQQGLKQITYDGEILWSANASPQSEVTQEIKQQTETETGGCLIATATYGTELAPQVQQLRELRDGTLLQTNSGISFMTGFNQFYYSFSPTIADWERQNPVFREAVKLAITPLITSLSIMNYVDMDSEAEVLGYGISLILLNVGMYIVAPVGIGIFVFRKKSKFI